MSVHRKSVYEIQRGSVVFAVGMSGTEGSEIGGYGRPWLVISNNVGNKHSTTVIAAAITTRPPKSGFPCHVSIGDESGLLYQSTVQTEQLRTISKNRIDKVCGYAPAEVMQKVDAALLVSLGLT